MNNFRITQHNSQGNFRPFQKRELILTPSRKVMIDAKRARHWLDALAQLLLHASQSPDSRELIAGIDLVRKAPGMLPGLEIR